MSWRDKGKKIVNGNNSAKPSSSNNTNANKDWRGKGKDILDRNGYIPPQMREYPLTTTDGKNFGKVSYNAYNAIVDNKLDNYKPATAEEESVLNEFKAYVSQKRRKKSEAEITLDKKYGIDTNTFSGKDLDKWAREHNYELVINANGAFYKPKRSGFLGFGKKLTTDAEDKDFEVLKQIAGNTGREVMKDEDLGTFVAAAVGAVDGMSFGLMTKTMEDSAKREYKKAGLNEENYSSLDEVFDNTTSKHPVASFVGDIAGSYLMTGAIGSGVSAGTKALKVGEGIAKLTSKLKWFNRLAPEAQKIVNFAVKSAVDTGVTFGTTNAVGTAVQGGDAGDIAKSAGIGFASGVLGSGASTAVNVGLGKAADKLGTKLLGNKLISKSSEKALSTAANGTIPEIDNALNALYRNYGLKDYWLPRQFVQAASSAAFAIGNTGSNILLNTAFTEGYKPDANEITKAVAVSFLFSFLSSVSDYKNVSTANKTAINKSVKYLSQDAYTLNKMKTAGMTNTSEYETVKNRITRNIDTLEKVFGASEFVGIKGEQQQLLSGLKMLREYVNMPEPLNLENSTAMHPNATNITTKGNAVPEGRSVNAAQAGNTVQPIPTVPITTQPKSELAELASEGAAESYLPEGASDTMQKLESELVLSGANDEARKAIIDNVSQVTVNSSIPEKQAVNGLNTLNNGMAARVKENTGLDINKNSLLAANAQALAAENGTESNEFIKNYTVIFVDALKRQKGETYKALESGTNNVSEVLAEYITGGSLPEDSKSLSGTGEFEAVSEQLKGFIEQGKSNINRMAEKLYGKKEVPSIQPQAIENAPDLAEGFSDTAADSNEIRTLSRPISKKGYSLNNKMVSVFKDSPQVLAGTDIIMTGHIGIRNDAAALDDIRKVAGDKVGTTEATFEKLVNKNATMQVTGDPKYLEHTIKGKIEKAYLFNVNGKIYGVKQEYLEAFNNGENTFYVSDNQTALWNVKNKNGDIIGVIAPIYTKETSVEQFNSLPNVSNVLSNKKAADEAKKAEIAERPFNDNVIRLFAKEGKVLYSEAGNGDVFVTDSHFIIRTSKEGLEYIVDKVNEKNGSGIKVAESKIVADTMNTPYGVQLTENPRFISEDGAKYYAFTDGTSALVYDKRFVDILNKPGYKFFRSKEPHSGNNYALIVTDDAGEVQGLVLPIMASDNISRVLNDAEPVKNFFKPGKTKSVEKSGDAVKATSENEMPSNTNTEQQDEKEEAKPPAVSEVSEERVEATEMPGIDEIEVEKVSGDVSDGKAKSSGRTKDTTSKLDDFGEKIGGAKKDLWNERGLLFSDIDGMNEREASKFVKKDNVWKKNNYQEMIDNGIPADVVYFVKTVRDSLDVSPAILRSDNTPELIKERQKQYINTVREIQEAVLKIKTNEDALSAFKNILVDGGYISDNGEGSYRRYSLTEKGKNNPAITNKLFNALLKSERSYQSDIVNKAKKEQFGVPKENKIPKGFSIHFNDGSGYSKNNDWEPNTYYITKGYSIIKTNFATEGGALSWLQDFAKKKPTSGKTRFVPEQLEEIHREGIDYRENNTKDVDGQDYLNAFGFKGGEFGNWVNQNERQISLNYGYDALMDLADALGIGKKDISLNGTLSIAFGSRGSGNALAHYEPLRKVINLTKMKGAGSLAHEWGHALDDYLGSILDINGFATAHSGKLQSLENLINTIMRKTETVEQAEKRIENQKTRDMRNAKGWVESSFRYLTDIMDDSQKAELERLTESFLNGEDGTVEKLNNLKKGIDNRLIPKDDRTQLETYLRIMKGYQSSEIKQVTTRTDFYKNSIRMDNNFSKDGDYWQSKPEMFARAFACYVTDKLQAKSDYLSGHSETAVGFEFSKDGEMELFKAFPEGDERKAINQAFDEFFNDIKDDKGYLNDKKASCGNFSIVRYSLESEEALSKRKNNMDRPDIRHSFEDEATDLFKADEKLVESFSKQVDEWETANSQFKTLTNLSSRTPKIIAKMQELRDKLRQPLNLGNTSVVLQELGADNLPMMITSGAMDKATAGTDFAHEISIGELKKLPAELADPIMVFNSDTDKGTTSKGVPRSLVVLTTLKSVRGHEVVVAVHLNKKQGFVEINDIASVHSRTNTETGKNQIVSFINNQLTAGNLRYIDKNKSDEWLRRGGLQLPSLNTIIASNNNILHKEDIVNSYYMQNSKKDEQGVKLSAERNLYNDGNMGRQAGEDSSKPIQEVAGRAEGTGEIGKAGQRDYSTRRVYAENVKADGRTKTKVTHGARIEAISPEAYNDDIRSIIAENKDVELEFYIGGADIALSGGKKAKGIIIGKTKAMIQYDHPDYTPLQILEHERVHKDYNSSRVQKARSIIENSLSISEKRRITKELYKNYYALTDGNEEKVFEEFIADVLSGMSDYSIQFEQLANDYQRGSDIIDYYDPSTYAESIDAGGANEAFVDSIGFGEGAYLSVEDNASTAGATPDTIDDAKREWKEKGTDSKYFKKWFGDSKVVDKDGKPLVVYHGSSEWFNVFDKGKIGTGEGSALGEGFYFTKKEDVAYAYGNRVSEVFLSLKNPFVLGKSEMPSADTLLDKYFPNKWEDSRESGVGYINRKLQSAMGTLDLVKYIAKENNTTTSEIFKQLGYDGVIDGAEIVVFEPAQIKSATDNIGTFKPDNPDIRYSLDSEIDGLTPERKKEIDKQYYDSKYQKPKLSAKEAWGERTGWVLNNITRVFPEIPERGDQGEFFAEFRKYMIQWKHLPTTASFMTQENLNKMTEGLSPEEFDAFSKLVYYRDLQEEAQIQEERGYEEILLPNGITPSEVNAFLKELEGEATENVKSSLGKRQGLWDNLKETYITLNQMIGFNTDNKFKRKNYYHHQVIEYANEDYEGTGRRSVEVNSGRDWLKERQGSTKAINTDFLNVEYKAMLQMQYDIYIANTLSKIKEQYDVKPEFEKQAYEHNRKTLDEIITKEATDDSGNYMSSIKNGKVIPDSETYREMQWYNQRIMFGFSGLFNLADNGELPEFDGQYGNVIRALKAHDVGAVQQSSLYRYVADIASFDFGENVTDNQKQAQISTRTVLKYTSQKKAWTKEKLGRNYWTWETIAEQNKDTHSVIQPRRGNYFYTKEVINEDAFEKALDNMIDGILKGQGVDPDSQKLFEQYKETVKMIGAAYEQWVVPKEIEVVMNKVANPKQAGRFWNGVRALTTTWKGWATSVNPLRTVKFGIRNLGGDLDAVIAGKPQILKYSKQAVAEIYNAMRHKKYTSDFMDWIERGGYSSMIFANEMDTEMQNKLFGHLKEKTGKNALQIPAKLVEGYAKGVENAHNFREAILRYAAYLYFKDTITQNGGQVKDYVASNRFIVRGLHSLQDKAYQLSKDLLGAYDEVGAMGQTLRRYLVPFFSFTETNAKRYYRLFENIIASDASIPKKAAKLMLKTLMVNLLTLLLIAWSKLVMKDDEEKLPKSVAARPHVTLGSSGDNVYAFTRLGSFSELLEWLGLDDYELTKGDVYAPVNKAWGMVTPLIKVPFEYVTGITYYPEIENPSGIRDKIEYVFNSLGLADIYKEVTGKPTEGVGDIIEGAFLYKYDYKESAYWEIYDLKYEFQGKEGNIYKYTDKSNALYYMKKAVRYGDKEAALKYLDKYFESGGTASGIVKSFATMNPLYGFTSESTIEKGEAFKRTLNDSQKEKLRIAIRYYENDLSLPDDVVMRMKQKNLTDYEAKRVLSSYINRKVGD